MNKILTNLIVAVLMVVMGYVAIYSEATHPDAMTPGSWSHTFGILGMWSAIIGGVWALVSALILVWRFGREMMGRNSRAD
jgi:hypothetical protein